MLMRQFAAQDLANILRLHRDPRVTRYLIDGVPDTLPIGQAYLSWLQEVYASGVPGPLHASLKDDGAFIGSFSLCRYHATDELEIGGRLFPHLWGRNLALEGGLALLQHAFGEMREPLVIGLADPANLPVQLVMARLGFAPQRRVEAYGKAALRFTQRREDWQQRDGAALPRRAAVAALRQQIAKASI